MHGRVTETDVRVIRVAYGAEEVNRTEQRPKGWPMLSTSPNWWKKSSNRFKKSFEPQAR